MEDILRKCHACQELAINSQNNLTQGMGLQPMAPLLTFLVFVKCAF